MLTVEKLGYVLFPASRPPERIAQREIHFALRGLAAALLFPYECLQFLRCGLQSGKKRKLSWFCSIAIYAAAWAAREWLRESLAGGPDHSQALLAAAAVFLLAAMANGHLQNALELGFSARSQTIVRIEKGKGKTDEGI